MSEREWPAVNGGGTLTRSADAPASGTRASHESNGDLEWEALLPLLKAARETQFVSADARKANECHQRVDRPTADSFRQLVQRILTRDPPELEPLPFVEPIELFDTELDGEQSDAVARALHGNDLFLIQGRPGTGKTRTVVELIRQAAARGRRVLLCARSGAAIDAVLAHLERLAHIEMIRLLGRDENHSTISASCSRYLLENRERAVRESAIARACEHERDVEAQLQQLRELTPVFATLRDWAKQVAELERQRTELRARRAKVHDDISSAIAAKESSIPDSRIDALRFQNSEHAQWFANWEAQRDDLQNQRSRSEEECRLSRVRCDELQSLEEAARSGRIWTWRYWQARRDKTLPDRLGGAQRDAEEKEQSLRAVEQRQQAHAQSGRDAETAHAAQTERMLADLCHARKAEIDQQLSRIDGEIARFSELGEQRIRTLPAEIERPSLSSVDSIPRAEIQHAELVGGLEQARTSAADWRTFAESEGELICRRWRDSIRLVAAPLSGLEGAWFDSDALPIDVTIVLNAHELVENEIIKAGRHGKQAVLIGEPPLPALARNHTNRHVTRSHPGRRTRPATDFYARLWDKLHQETWLRGNGRLSCLLKRVPAADRERLESECVANRPDVELRIWNRRPAEPALAEVHFPGTMCIGEAKDFLFRELGEIPCSSRYRTGRWESADDGLRFRVGPGANAVLPAKSIALAEGVTLRLDERRDDGEFAIVFCGWDRAGAEAWVRRHFQPRDSGRASVFERDYCHTPLLGNWLAEAIYGSAPPSLEPMYGGAIEFIAVPRRPASFRSRGGAGVEIDLTDAEQRLRLPADLAQHLPANGYVNPVEARAIVDLLPRLPRDQRVVVASPYRAQELLLKYFCPNACVDGAENTAVQGGECDLLIISLTRSHVARAVTYGLDPSTMLHLLPRARCRILFVGDPGTLARRAVWEGAIDQLDEIDGERERRWVRALLPYLPIRSTNAPARVPQNAQM
jgi:AAA domain